ncbi:MAG TPA: hypothetical protein PKD10_00220 [Paracoccaceae bacterium]|nr:hypothetical protein [Paracoccaceae bacterium]HMO70070.1 hypothetical protein [Paracoccaceae bacterium]
MTILVPADPVLADPVLAVPVPPALPAHLQGTRAGLFQLLRQQAATPTPEGPRNRSLSGPASAPRTAQTALTALPAAVPAPVAPDPPDSRGDGPPQRPALRADVFLGDIFLFHGSPAGA